MDGLITDVVQSLLGKGRAFYILYSFDIFCHAGTLSILNRGHETLGSGVTGKVRFSGLGRSYPPRSFSTVPESSRKSSLVPEPPMSEAHDEIFRDTTAKGMG